MDIKVKGVRKKTRIKWEVSLFTVGNSYTFWRTDRYSITRDVMKEAGLDVNKYGAVTSQLTFRIRKKT